MNTRALISVSNKENIVAFAKGLVELDYEIISTGGTLKTLAAENIPVKPVETVTGFPEILDGRVKTLHPNIHGGLLAKHADDHHQQQLAENNIQPIDLVVVNLYPFKETLDKEGVSEDEIIENIDIGGPTMLRAAAKNYLDVTVVVDPNDYDSILSTLQEHELTIEQRKQLAAKVFRHTAHYDAMIDHYFSILTNEESHVRYNVTY